MWTGILKVGLMFLNMFMKRKVRDEKMTESYYSFLKQIDNAGMANVANYLAAENSLAAKRKEIADRLKKEKANNAGN